jgi:hypothetical protein
MKTNKAIFFCMAIVLGAAALSAQTEADFRTKDNGDGSVTITGYSGWDTAISIPAAIGGKAVTAIGNGAFRNTDLTGVVIPDSVRTIGEGAFVGNKLTQVTISADGVSIHQRAFTDNLLLTSVTLGADCDFGQFSSFGYFTFFSYLCNGRKAGAYRIDRAWDNNWGSSRSQDRERVMKTAEGYTYAETPYGLAVVAYNGESNRVSIPDKLNGNR